MTLPIIVLDCNVTFAFDNKTDPLEILYNHRIYGAEDMCNLLLRCNKNPMICVWE